MSLKIPHKGSSPSLLGEGSSRLQHHHLLLQTPDPLLETGPESLFASGSLTCSPLTLDTGSLELTWAPVERADSRTVTDDNSGKDLLPTDDHNTEETTATTNSNEGTSKPAGQKMMTMMIEDGSTGQGEEVQLVQLKDLEQLTEATLAQEGLACTAVSSSSHSFVENANASDAAAVADSEGGLLDTPAIFFDDAQDYFSVKKEDNSSSSSPKEVILELDLPVTSTEFSNLWEAEVDTHKRQPTLKEQIEAQAMTAPLLRPDPMACFNPFHVEGKMKTVVTEAKKPRKILPKLDIPAAQAYEPQPSTSNAAAPPAPAATTANSISTPAVEKVLGEAVGDEGGFDLLEWVTNTELPVNDPEFLALIGDTGSTPAITTIDATAIQATPSKPLPKGKKVSEVASTSQPQQDVSKPKRQRRHAPSAVADHSYLAQQPRPSTSRGFNTDDYSSAPSEDDVKEAKYRRMRDLNNLASKRCRQNRYIYREKISIN